MSWKFIFIAAATLTAGETALGDTQSTDERTIVDLDHVRDAAGGAVRKTRRGIEGVATQPLEDFNLQRDEIPQSIKDLESYTENDGALTCQAVAEEIDALDDALGREGPRAKSEKTISRRIADKAANTAVDVVEGEAENLIPFRSTIRKISGADAYEKRRRIAVSIGKQRRAYLRGAWAAMTCDLKLANDDGPRAEGAPISLVKATREDLVETTPLEAPLSPVPEAPTSSPPSELTAPSEAPENSRRKLPSLG
ncbi:MAG: hypothetical protein AAFW65_08770 [Pseudomonadota bacterium]